MVKSRIVFFAQLLVMLSAFTILAVTPAGFHTLGLMVCLVLVAAAATLFAAWQFIRHPSHRKWATATVLTPLVCLSAPFFLVQLNGGPVAPATAVAVFIAFLIVVCIVLLARTTLWHVGGIFANRRFNTGLMIALGALLTLYWIPIVTWLNMQESLELPNSISERDRILKIGIYYFVAVAGPALNLSLFALLYAPIGLARNSGTRLVHAGQLLAALIMLASLAIGAFFVGVAIFNPG